MTIKSLMDQLEWCKKDKRDIEITTTKYIEDLWKIIETERTEHSRRYYDLQSLKEAWNKLGTEIGGGSVDVIIAKVKELKNLKNGGAKRKKRKKRKKRTKKKGRKNRK